MNGRFSDILNPTISGFDPMLPYEGSLPQQEEQPSTSAAPETYPDQQHSKIDSRKRPASRIKSTYPRKRAIAACQKCRARRTKCNNVRPTCSSCEDLGVECSYSGTDPSSFDAASLAILEKLSTIEELLRTDSEDRHQHILASVTKDLVEDPSPASHVKSLNSPTLERTRDALPCHMNVENVLSWPVFGDQDPDLDLKGLLNDQERREPPNSSMGDFDHAASEEELVQSFMDHVFIFNPVLEEAQVQNYVRDARFNGIGWDSQSCLLLLIYANGALVGAIDPASPATDAANSRQTPHFRQAESYFSAAQRRMGLLLCQSGTTEAQCFFLAGVYLMACIRPLEAWKMFVQALACCQSFYSGKSRPNAEHERDKRLKESIYWTCFKSELELRLELNVAESSVWDLTYPSFFPSPPDELRSQREIVWYFYLAEIALRRLGNRVLNRIYTATPSKPTVSNTNTSDMIESILGFEQQASDWIRSLPRGLDLDIAAPGITPAEDSDLHTTLKFILSGHLLDCYEMMYWPFIAEALGVSVSVRTPTSPFGAQNNTTNANFIRKGLNICIERISKNEPGFFFRHHGTWLMLRSCTRSGLVLLAASRVDGIKQLLPDGWKTSVGKIVEMLRFWRRESRDVEDRLRLLESMWRTTVT